MKQEVDLISVVYFRCDIRRLCINMQIKC